jgi:DNA-directed RNA polymerase specialized sigma24 family protein
MRGALTVELNQARPRFLALVADVRPDRHRCCARMTGSVIDGEDIVQETLARARRRYVPPYGAFSNGLRCNAVA